METSRKHALVIDTTVSQNQPPALQQYVPRNQHRQPLNFVSLQDVEALRKNSRNRTEGSEGQVSRQDETHMRRGPRRSVRDDTQSTEGVTRAERPRSNAAALSHATPMPDLGDEIMPPMALHSRVRGLRPSPLDLSTDVSPSDRAIPIGLALSSSSLRVQKLPPLLSTNEQTAPIKQSTPVNEVSTPTIVITPARESFTFSASPDDFRSSGYRPPSSVYSRAQSHLPQPRASDVPAVPSLPFQSIDRGKNGSHSTRKLSDAATKDTQVRSQKQKKPTALAVRTCFEDENLEPSSKPLPVLKQIASQSLLPTPRRSRGWWNVITSPFSLTPKRSTFLSRSLSLREEDDDDESLLNNAQGNGIAESHPGLFQSNRAKDDESLRSAPPSYSGNVSLEASPTQLKRSDTAPGALDNRLDQVNIYRIPSQGAAAAYYDWRRNFPSFIGPAASRRVDDLTDWSPSQSVFRASLNRDVGSVVNDHDRDVTSMLDDAQRHSSVLHAEKQGDDAQGLFRGIPDSAGTASDTNFTAFSGTHPAAESNLFSSPGEPPAQMPAYPETPTRNETLQSHFSPCSPTPVIENARIATFLGPRSANVESREVEMASKQSRSPMGLATATMASRGADPHPPALSHYEFPEEDAMDEPAQPQFRGLGISDDEKRQLPPPPSPPFLPPAPLLSEKGRLGTDRFGQLRVETDDLAQDRESWYRRFFWSLVAVFVGLLVLLIVLLVIYIPQRIDNEPVEGQWMNLTAFPPLPTGVMTVIQPRNVDDVSGCVSPAAMWSCAMPAGEQGLHAAPVPNFRLEINFRNDTRGGLNNTDLQPVPINGSASLTARASALVKRNAWGQYLYTSSPSPPSTADQIFLGRTTDNNSYPYDGEETPFYISLLNASVLESVHAAALVKRDDAKWQWPLPSHSATSSPTSSSDLSSISSSGTSTPKSSSKATSSIASRTETASSDASTASTSASASRSGTSDTTESSSMASSSMASANNAPTSAPTKVPLPILKPNGQPAAAQLYPFVEAQPLRLFDRGLETEHYGFYTYLSRSLYVSSVTASNATTNSTRTSHSSSPSGSATTPNVPLSSAAAVCTWTETRFLVQIWTRRPPPKGNALDKYNRILSGGDSPSSIPAGSSTANDMTAPGSFPYAVTITLDRHGGQADEKGVFCYGVNEDENGDRKVDTDAKMWFAENRGVGGRLLHPAEVPGATGGSGLQRRDESEGGEGIDGGTGGCACAWQNWS